MMRMLSCISPAVLSLLTLFPASVSAGRVEVGPGCRYTGIDEALVAAKDYDTVLVRGGTYFGNFVVTRPVYLTGENYPVLDGRNKGTVLTVTAPGVTVEGFTIRNSGILLDKEDAGILVEADGAILRNNRLGSVLFGIYFKRSDDGLVENNRIEGKRELDIPRRGDLFRSWYSSRLEVRNNYFRYGRDVIIWFSDSVLIENNNMSDARYGLHFMYNNDCRIIHNIMTGNSVGMYLMYSRRILVKKNLIAGNRGPSGFGAGLKDMDNVVLTNNVIADNRVGVFVDNSPRSYTDSVRYENNLIAYNETGMEFMSVLSNSILTKNSFLENYRQTSLSSGQRSVNHYWQGNYWSDYSGYDINGDGTGDLAYNSIELAENLLEEKPDLKIFLYSPAVNTLNYAAAAFPILRPRPKLTDAEPAVRPSYPANIPTLPVRKGRSLFLLSAVLTGSVISLLVRFRFKNGFKTGNSGTLKKTLKHL